jgi:hypothetical protein
LSGEETSLARKVDASDFFTLDAVLARKNAPRAVLAALDLMHLNGEDMRARGRGSCRTGDYR